MSKYKSNVLSGNKVICHDNMPINVALRKFKQKVEDSGVLEEVKSRMSYEKPTSVKKRKKGAARARWLKKLKSQEIPKRSY